MTANTSVWRNWSRTEKVVPRRVERPRSAEAVQRAVAVAARDELKIKAVGAGHSFTGIAVSPGVMLDVTGLRGVLGVNEVKRQVRFGAGTHLHEVPALLHPYGLALQNMGDIDAQTIAGAISTGTHGTGSRFGGLATQIVALSIVTGTGDMLHISELEHPELLPAARVGLGSLGIIVDVTLQCVPHFLLHAVERPEPLPEVLDGFLERSASADHFEFYWFPHTQTALTKTNTRLPGDAETHPLSVFGRWVDDEVIANGLYRATCALGRSMPSVIPPINRLADRMTGNRDFTDAWNRVFVSNRGVRFREMEYALPRAAVPEAMREIDRLIERNDWKISFPLEVRSAAADENWLSTAYRRETGYVAVHRYYRESLGAYFREVERVFVAHAGRPHWGKLHNRSAADLRGLYPRFDDFLAVREELDPQRLFGNPYLERVFGDGSLAQRSEAGGTANAA